MASWNSISLVHIVVYVAILSRYVQVAGLITIKNVTVIGAQTNPGLAVSRDGGVSVLLNGKVLWLFDDTTVTNSFGTLVSFSSNSAAIASNSNDVTALRDISYASVDAGGTKVAPQTNAGDQISDWILLSPSELEFNQNQTSRLRLAIWPGTNPLAVSPALAWLWAPVVQVSNVTSHNSKTVQQEYTYQYTTLAKIEDTKSGLTAARPSDRLFVNNTELSGRLSPFGCFASLVGKTSECYDEHLTVCLQHFVYLLGVYGDGLQRARLPLHEIGKPESAYEFWQSEYCNFSLPEDTSKLSPSSKSYLQGSFSTGSVFYSSFFETFILVYMNAEADSTLYVRYLDLNNLLCAGNGTVWQKGGNNGQGIKKEDAEAIIHYQWSDSQVLVKTPAPADSTKYNYAGMAHPEYFNRQYYQDWMYSNGGIDSDMRSPWLGQDIITEADAGGDGKHLMVSWTTPGKNGYEIAMAKVELNRVPDSSAECRGCTRSNAVLVAALALLLL